MQSHHKGKIQSGWKNEGKMRNALHSDLQTQWCATGIHPGDPNRLQMQMTLLIIFLTTEQTTACTQGNGSDVTDKCPFTTAIHQGATNVPAFFLLFCRDLESSVLFLSPKEKKKPKKKTSSEIYYRVILKSSEDGDIIDQ